MATVHLGRLLGPVGFSRTVAIKRLHAQFAKDQDFVSMFLDEARLAGRIQHPNVVQTLDVVANDQELFLVMEYLQGESLSRLWKAALLGDTGGMPPTIVSAILGGTLHGLHAVHEARDERGAPLGIVHRDISPQNILVGVDGVPRVLDFGVAKAAGRIQQTREGQLKGKLPYMAPEQLTGGANVTRQTDIYSAAVVLWECLTGQRLFDGENEARIFGRVLDGYVPPPSQFRPGLPPSLDGVVLRGLDRDPSRRFSTAREMALALDACVRAASSTEVGSWVEHLASAALNKRAQQVADLDSSSAVKVPVRPQMMQALAAGGAQAFNMAMAATYPALEPQRPGNAVNAGFADHNQMPTRIERIEQRSEPQMTPPPPATDVTRSWTHRTGGGATVSGPHPYVPVAPPSASGPYNAGASMMTGAGFSAPAAAPSNIWVKVLVAVASAALVVALIAAFFAMRGSLAPAPAPVAASTGVTAPKASAVTIATVATALPTSLPTEALTATPIGVVAPQAMPTSASPVTSAALVTSKPAATSTPATPSTGAAAKTGTTAPKAHTGAVKADPCAVPYTRDDKGVKIYKPECLQ
ncbi:MAG: protein kinase [Myxococcaceae bacterium]|nr:protein kinase [Myxococcaceae bacterium]